jgi:response regulator RpfG family c-di-GMP phosphodiesterase
MLDSFIRYVGKGDVWSYLESNKTVAEKIAISDIYFEKFIRIFHLFEDSYMQFILNPANGCKKTIEYLTTLDKLNHETIIVVSKYYIELYNDTVFALAKLAELRDNETGMHLERTRYYSSLISLNMGFDSDFTDNIYKSAPLHDIGKVGIPDSILLKPGRLTEEEFNTMKTHSMIGYNTIKQIMKNRNVIEGSMLMARDIIHYHHEKYDGSGYPEGLEGDNIPIAARIFALADAYDAIVSKRPYKQPLHHDIAVDRILSSRETHFDPQVVDTFIRVEKEFDLINKDFTVVA